MPLKTAKMSCKKNIGEWIIIIIMCRFWGRFDLCVGDNSTKGDKVGWTRLNCKGLGSWHWHPTTTITSLTLQSNGIKL